MNLPPPSPTYDREDQTQIRRIIAAADKANVKTGQIIERLIMVSPNGTKYIFTVSDAGAAVFTAV